MVLKMEKVAIITGSTGGLGKAVTRTFLDAGFKVAATFTSEEGLDALISAVQSTRENFYSMKANVLDEPAVKSLVQSVVDKFRQIDCLIHIVGGFVGGMPIVETTEEQWDKMMSLNLKSAFLCSKHVMPVMMKQETGKIINIGARGGLKAVSGMAAYSASKAGVINLTQALAEEGRKFNITANAIVPSIIDTPDNRQAMPDADFSKWVKPDIIAQLILFLCSPAADPISGAVIPVYGKS